MTRTLSILLVIAIAFPAYAQPHGDEPPIVGRPADFSNIVGKYTIQVSAEPLEVAIEEPITLTIRIVGSGPAKYEPQRKYLQLFPNWDDDFYIESAPEADCVLKAEKTWMFVYRLRPKHTKVTAIDDIKLSYYDPSARDFRERYAPRIEGIRVKPKARTGDDIVTRVSLPASFYQVSRTENVLAQMPAPFAVSGIAFVLVLITPPVGCAIALVARRRFFPDDAARHAYRRSQAASNALVQLKYTGGRPWKVVQLYLKERFDFALDDPTPMDVAAFLRRSGFTKSCCILARAFFQASDALRYTAAPKHGNDLHIQGAGLIQALESDPCAR